MSSNKYKDASTSVFHNLDSCRVCFSALLNRPSGRRGSPRNPPPEPFGLLQAFPNWGGRNPKLRFGLATEVMALLGPRVKIPWKEPKIGWVPRYLLGSV